METDPAPSGGGRLLHRASSVEWSLFLGVTGDSPLGHPSTCGIRKKKVLVNLLFAIWTSADYTHTSVQVKLFVCALTTRKYRAPVQVRITNLQVLRLIVWGGSETTSTTIFFTLNHMMWDTYGEHAVARVRSIGSWTAQQRAHSPRSALRRQEIVFVKTPNSKVMSLKGEAEP